MPSGSPLITIGGMCAGTGISKDCRYDCIPVIRHRISSWLRSDEFGDGLNVSSTNGGESHQPIVPVAAIIVAAHKAFLHSPSTFSTATMHPMTQASDKMIHTASGLYF